jgi:hypothetical protein
VRGHGEAVVEVAVFGGGEFDQSVVIDPCGDPAIARNGFDNREIPVRDAKLLTRRGDDSFRTVPPMSSSQPVF